MFRKILIANRGEIACRIIKTARRMGITSVAVYSTADQNSLAISLADEAYCIGEPPSALSYLNIDAIIKAALESGAEAIHPGYGFLSENPALAKACAKAGLTFIGPSISAMEAMASKQVAKQLLEPTDVPLTPGYHGTDQSDSRLRKEAQRLGFPILLKAASGGGGKGMRIVEQASELEHALTSARREAKASFGDDTLLLEKLVSQPRHVEVQIMADNHGQIVHLFERDCSIQRRHQKIIEEAPAPNITLAMRKKLAKAAITVARTIHYHGAGTVEFLVDGRQFYFMEMNTRLQVEHPVTEMITGLDLVEWQIRIAANEVLPSQQSDIKQQGHAIECRIYAEDPKRDFLPSIGEIRYLREPIGEGIRIDSGVTEGSSITMHYDPMIAKLIAFGETRTQALQRLQSALTHYHIGGVTTNIPFLHAIISHPNFAKAKLSTHFLQEYNLTPPKPDPEKAAYIAASLDFFQHLETAQRDPVYADTFAWQMHLKSSWHVQYRIADTQYEVTVTPSQADAITLSLNQRSVEWQIQRTHQAYYLNDGRNIQRIDAELLPDKIILYTEQGPITVERFDWNTALQPKENTEHPLVAPMPATVVAVLKQKGDAVKSGELLMILEAMKMEHSIRAPNDGLLTDIFFDIGAQVHEGATLVELKANENRSNEIEGMP